MMSPSQGRFVLISTILASSMAFIDGSALNVVLPTLQTDLGASGSQLVWILNGYILMLASFILIGGSLGDQYGRNKVFGTGIILFTAASLICGIAPDANLLILARAIQGIGGALMVPGSLAIITANFPPDSRGQAIGIWSAASTITTLGGPILGGLLADAGLWRLVFFINLPLAMVALWALGRVPETRSEGASRHIDIPGAACITIGLAGLTYGLITLGELGIQAGLQDGVVVASLIIGVLALAAFVWIEATTAHPMVNLTLFKSRDFSGANLMTAFLYGALTGGLTFLPLNLIQVQNYSSSEASLVMLPFPIILGILSPWAGRWSVRIGPRIPLTLGPSLVGAGFFALSLPGLTNGVGDYFTSYFPGIVLMGLGMGVTVAPLVATVMNAVSEAYAGVASGVNNAVTRSAQALCTALFGALALALFAGGLTDALRPLELPDDAKAALIANAGDLAGAEIPAGLSGEQAEAAALAVREGFVDAFQSLMLGAAVMCFISAGLSAVVLQGRKSTV